MKVLGYGPGAAWYVLFLGTLIIKSTVGSSERLALEFRGHDVSLRPAYMSRDGRHTFVDANVTLTRGTLKAFRLFVHNLASDTPLGDVTAQIWRPLTAEGPQLADEDDALRLVWRKHLRLRDKNSVHVATLTSAEEFQVLPTDLLGFQCETNTCPISMSISPMGRTFIREAQNHRIGKVVYGFRGPVATVFSIGVDILPERESSSSTRESSPSSSEVALEDEELLGMSPPQEHTSTASQGAAETSSSGVSETDVEVARSISTSREDQEDSSSTETEEEEEEEVGFEEPSYNAEQRQEMLGANVMYHGHNLTLEDHFLGKQGRKTYLDTSFQLQRGVLKAISLFIHDAPINLDNLEDMYLELWTRHGATSGAIFQLEWRKKIKLTRGTNRMYEFILNPEDQVPVTERHLLGFSNLDHICPVSFRYTESGRTLFRALKRYEGPPDVGSLYRFNKIHEPITFSMGALVSPQSQTGSDQQEADENDVMMPDLIRLGHSLIPREFTLPNQPITQAFVDRSTHLVPGFITKFEAFIAPLHASDLDARIRFQVWTYNGTAGEGATSHSVYRLKWQQSFPLSSLTKTTRGRIASVYEVRNRVQVDAHDRIGFACEGRNIPIPYHFNSQSISLSSSTIDAVDVLTLNKTSDGHVVFPEVRPEPYHFNPGHSPITWSIQIEFQPLARR